MLFIIVINKTKSMNLDSLLVKAVKKANKSFIGKPLSSLSEKIGSPSLLAFLHILFTAALGFIVTYPLYLAGGFWLALPTGFLAVLVVSSIFISVFLFELGYKGHIQRKLLVFAMLFSMPFGLLSLPLLHKLSKKEKSA